MVKHASHVTIDHDEIRRWAAERGGRPARVDRRGGQAADGDLVRIGFPGDVGKDSLEPISWREFFEKFDANHLALVVQDRTIEGERSNFNKVIKRGAAD